MGRTPWATEDETAWLQERLPDFRVARANETSAQFMAAANQAYFDTFWPGIDDNGAAAAGPNGVTFKARKQQLYWWFWNRRFGKTGVKKAREGIDFSAKKPGKLQPYQAYMSLFKATVMPDLKKQYEAHKSSVAEDEECEVWWSFAMEQAKEMLQKETDEVKAQVEKFCQDRAHVEQGLDGFVLDPVDDPAGDNDLRARARHIQGLLDALPQSLQNVLDSLEQQTGWKGTIMVGGPRPETGKFAVLCLHQGRTLNLGHLFSEATPNWPTIEAAYSEFIVSCFPQDVCKKVHEAYRGLATPAQAPEASSSTSQAAVPLEAATGSTDTPSLANPDSESSTPTSSDPAAEPKTKKKKKGKTNAAKAKTNSEPSYEELREETMRQNRAHMEALGLTNAALGLTTGKKPTRKAKKPQTSEATPTPGSANGATDAASASSLTPAALSVSSSTPPAESAPPPSSQPSPPVLPTSNSSLASAVISTSVSTPLPAPSTTTTVQSPNNGVVQAEPTPATATHSTAALPRRDVESGVTSLVGTIPSPSMVPLDPAAATVTTSVPTGTAPPTSAAKEAPTSDSDTRPLSPTTIPAAPSLPPAVQETTRSDPTAAAPNGVTVHDATLNPMPSYISDALKYFELVEGGPAWRDLVSTWVEFERSLGFPESSQDRAHWLSAKDRPEEVKMWTKCARSYDKLPKIKSSQQYAVGWKQWWVSLQPQCRLPDPTAWPPSCIEPSDDKDWGAIRRGGPNGMFLAVISLAWWLWAVLDAGECKLDVEKAIADVAWVCKTASTPALPPTSCKRSVDVDEGQEGEGSQAVAKRARKN